MGNCEYIRDAMLPALCAGLTRLFEPTMISDACKVAACLAPLRATVRRQTVALAQVLVRGRPVHKAGSHTPTQNGPCGGSSQGQAGMAVASHILGSSWDTIIRLWYDKQDHNRDV